MLIKPILNTSNRNLEAIFRNRQNYITDLIYQREPCWNKKSEIQLLISICNDIPIGTFHVVLEDDSDRKSVLDGKQRLTTILNFFDNGFKIPVIESDKKVIVPLFYDPKKNKNTYKNFNWDEIQTKADSGDVRYKALSDKINYYDKFYIVEYPSMSIEEQVTLFEKINHSEPLDTNEKIYCSNYKARQLYEVIYKESCLESFMREFCGYSKYFKDNGRFKSTRVTHNLCMLLFGESFIGNRYLPGPFNSKIEIQVDKTTSDAKVLHNALLNEKLADKLPNRELINKLSLEKQIKDLQQIVKLMDRIAKYENDLANKKHISYTTFLRYMAMLGRNMQANIFTEHYIILNLEKFSNALKNMIFILQDPEEKKKYTTSNGNSESINMYISKLESLLKLEGVDFSVKNQKISLEEQRRSAFDAPKRSPFNNEKLTDKNTHLDHVQPKAVSSDTSAQFIIDAHNRQKGCNPIKES